MVHTKEVHGLAFAFDRRSFAPGWRGDGHVLHGALGAALLEDEELARLIELRLVPLDDGGGVRDDRPAERDRGPAR